MCNEVKTLFAIKEALYRVEAKYLRRKKVDKDLWWLVKLLEYYISRKGVDFFDSYEEFAKMAEDCGLTPTEFLWHLERW